ncbi:hypothetical protein SETIT_9G055200v2 [Setaria italica]|uniref:Uncharacterized protein n=2 Tax=Setaria TaxID=4554 RepID=A0A368SDD3_SETIT|nr:hypothetical protein SETIT_9G055200v2 [Setaria italica]TKV90824.1 hypothetical protein SEVIR_9G054700v2 [Setaria viridis]
MHKFHAHAKLRQRRTVRRAMAHPGRAYVIDPAGPLVPRSGRHAPGSARPPILAIRPFRWRLREPNLLLLILEQVRGLVCWQLWKRRNGLVFGDDGRSMLPQKLQTCREEVRNWSCS